MFFDQHFCIYSSIFKIFAAHFATNYIYSKGWIAQVRKLNIVAQKRSGKPRKSWDEVLLDDRKKLGMDTPDPQNRSEWRGRLRRRLVKQVQPSGEDNRL